MRWLGYLCDMVGWRRRLGYSSGMGELEKCLAMGVGWILGKPNKPPAKLYFLIRKARDRSGLYCE